MFRKLFSPSPEAKLEERLVSELSKAYELMGTPRLQAQSMAKEILAMSRKELQEQGLNPSQIYQEGNGERFLVLAQTDPKTRAQLDTLHQHGVTDEDVRRWHDLSFLEKRVYLNTDKTIMMSEVRVLMGKGLTQEAALSQVFGHHATFTDDTNQITDENSFLPEELKLKVVEYRNKRLANDPEALKSELDKASTFNALIREKLQKGLI